jgi:hypothetical protein
MEHEELAAAQRLEAGAQLAVECVDVCAQAPSVLLQLCAVLGE